MVSMPLDFARVCLLNVIGEPFLNVLDCGVLVVTSRGLSEEERSRRGAVFQAALWLQRLCLGGAEGGPTIKRQKSDSVRRLTALNPLVIRLKSFDSQKRWLLA